jgi:hypothetical protein
VRRDLSITAKATSARSCFAPHYADDVSAHTDERLIAIGPKGCDQTHMVDEIELSHMNGFTLAERPLETMEPEAHRIGTHYELLKCVSKTFTVVGMDAPDDDSAAIPSIFPLSDTHLLPQSSRSENAARP